MKFRIPQSRRSKLVIVVLVVVLLAAIAFALALPRTLFTKPYSTVLLDANGNLLGAQVAADHQWRFPLGDSIPPDFEKALLSFEDRRFYRHPGIRLGSLSRAMIQNLRSRRVVSGGSTLTMQVVRLWRDGKPRNIGEKVIEIFLALRLEISYSKEEILRLYCAHAPFGGNVVGLEAASWRYFGCSPHQLSLGESATLAVLPNSPGLIYPGRNQKHLLDKRNRLLNRMLEQGVIDSLDCFSAMSEPLPSAPKPLPSFAYHLLHRTIAEGHQGERLHSTLQLDLQRRLQNACQRNQEHLESNLIMNLAALVLDTRSGAVLAYQGNSRRSTDQSGESIDMVSIARSTGSILKPILYASMLDEGQILPNQLVEDIPTFLGSFHPENFDRQYEGAVPAGIALARSLNVPAVRMLRQYGLERFHNTLKSMGISSLNHPPSHYGLSLILGGAEASLWDISGLYAGMGRQLLHYCNSSSTYLKNAYHPPYFLKSDRVAYSVASKHSFPNASSIWFTFNAMARVNRPQEESHWRQFSSSIPVSWKTGTSFGFRDAWAIAVTPEYTVAVWCGNANNEGRPGITGVKAAAPLLFDILNILRPSSRFPKPWDDMDKLPVCRESGYRAGPFCAYPDTLSLPLNASRADLCPFHTQVYIDARSGKRVSSLCRSNSILQPQSWFVLPPEVEYYYRQKHPIYKVLPPYMPGCDPGDSEENIMAILYPREGARILIPGVSDDKAKVVFEATHRQAEAVLYWFIDKQYVSTTSRFHKLELRPAAGEHLLTITDMDGNSRSCRFTITLPQ
jgi:penicillin-binding protein 1C